MRLVLVHPVAHCQCQDIWRGRTTFPSGRLCSGSDARSSLPGGQPGLSLGDWLWQSGVVHRGKKSLTCVLNGRPVCGLCWPHPGGGEGAKAGASTRTFSTDAQFATASGRYHAAEDRAGRAHEMFMDTGVVFKDGESVRSWQRKGISFGRKFKRSDFESMTTFHARFLYYYLRSVNSLRDCAHWRKKVVK